MTEPVRRDHAAGAPPASVPSPAQTANLALRFVLELSALAALAYWGLDTGRSWVGDLVLGLGAPLLAATVWATWAAPNSARRLDGRALLAVQLSVLGAGAAALIVAQHPVAGLAMALLIGVNALFLQAQKGQ